MWKTVMIHLELVSPLDPRVLGLDPIFSDPTNLSLTARNLHDSGFNPLHSYDCVYNYRWWHIRPWTLQRCQYFISSLIWWKWNILDYYFVCITCTCDSTFLLVMVSFHFFFHSGNFFLLFPFRSDRKHVCKLWARVPRWYLWTNYL